MPEPLIAIRAHLRAPFTLTIQPTANLNPG